MKLTPAELEMVARNRRAAVKETERKAREQAKWEAEQKRLDTPGLGCLDCDKTERQVWQERDEAGFITLTQGCKGGGMFPSTLKTIFSASLCAACLRNRAAGIQRKP